MNLCYFTLKTFVGIVRFNNTPQNISLYPQQKKNPQSSNKRDSIINKNVYSNNVLIFIYLIVKKLCCTFIIL